MGATTSVVDFSDLFTDLLNRARSETGDTPTTNIAKRYINTGLQDMHLGTAEKLPWAERRNHLITQPSYSTGTIAITKGSTSLTGTGTLWNTNNDFSVSNARAGGKIKLTGPETYTVDSVGSDTAITLAEKYVGDTISSLGSYNYFEDAYALEADFGRPLDQRSFGDGWNIPLIGRNEFRRRYPRNNLTGTIVVASIMDHEFVSNATPVRKIHFHRAPTKSELIPYSYITRYLAVSSSGTRAESLSADADEPIVPMRMRTMIVLRALHIWLRDRKDDANADKVLAEYQGWVDRMVGDNEIGDTRPRIHMATSMYTRKARMPYRRTGRRYDINGRFDRMQS